MAAVDQGPSFIGAAPPVFGQIYYELGAAVGTHIITPPDLAGGAGDGTLYVLVVRGLSPRAGLVATGQTHATGSAIPGVSVALTGPTQPGDFVIALGGYDDAIIFGNAHITDPPAGWTSAGVQNDSSKNVPSAVCYRVASSAEAARVTWTWDDPTANVTAAAIAAFR